MGSQRTNEESNEGCCLKFKQLFQWITLLNQITDDELMIICGTDGALYLVFLRYASRFFASVTVINFLVFIPIYLTGTNDDKDMRYNKDMANEISFINIISLISIKGQLEQVTIVFVVMILCYTFLMFALMYTYWKKAYSWRHKEHSHHAKFIDSDIAMHSVMVSNLDKTIPAAKMTELLKNVFEKLFPGPKVINCQALSTFDNLYKQAKDLREYKKLFKYYKRRNKLNSLLATRGEAKLERKTLKKRKSCFTTTLKYDAEDYYHNKMVTSSENIKREQKRKQTSNGGFGFVTFQSNLQVKKCLFTGHFKRLMMENLSPEER